MKEGTERTRGRDAMSNNIAAAIVIAEAIRTSLGPRGMDKMLVDQFGDVVITNDGATILKEIDVQHPAAKMMVEVAKTQDSEVGDGTTTSVILAGELLKRAKKLIEQKIHPTVITEGFRKAAEREIVNFTIQSPAGALTIRIIVRLDKILDEFIDAGQLQEDDIYLVNNVHDSATFEVKDHLIDWFSNIIKTEIHRPVPELANAVFPGSIGVGSTETEAEANTK